MANHLFVLFFIFLLNSAAYAEAVTQLWNTPTRREIQLDLEAQKVLKKWDENFKVFSIKDYPATVVDLFKDAPKELPMAVLADFNGDQKQDIALMGHNNTKERIVILMAQKKSYVAIEVSSRNYVSPEKSFIETEEQGRQPGLSLYLSLLESKELQYKKNKTYKNKPDALQLENYLGSTNAYYLKPAAKNKFEVKEYKGMIDE
jgi:hypothetical protein